VDDEGEKYNNYETTSFDCLHVGASRAAEVKDVEEAGRCSDESKRMDDVEDRRSGVVWSVRTRRSMLAICLLVRRD
jgi:hypothetical protein